MRMLSLVILMLLKDNWQLYLIPRVAEVAKVGLIAHYPIIAAAILLLWSPIPILHCIAASILRIWQIDLNGHIAIIQFHSIGGVEDQLLPIGSHQLRVADELPLGLVGLGYELNSERLILGDDVLDPGQVQLDLHLGDVGLTCKGKEGLAGDVPGVSDELDALEHQQSLIGEYKTLVLLLEQSVDVGHVVDLLIHGLHLDFVLDLVADYLALLGVVRLLFHIH